MKALFRMIAILLLSAATAFGAHLSATAPEEKTLAVSVIAPDDNQIAQALDAKDLERFFVSELKPGRITALPLTSIDDPEEIEGLYVLEVSIDQADTAQRPIWNWVDKRYRDDEILHLELSLSVTRFSDKSLGSLYYSRDYRAADYGIFSAPGDPRSRV